MSKRSLIEGASLQYRNELGLNSNNSIGTHIANLTGKDEYFNYDLGEVIDIINSKDHAEFRSNEDIGKIKIRLLNDLDKEENFLIWAWPVNSSILQYPVKGEIVNVSKYLGRYFYFGSINFSNNVNNNLLTGISSSPSKDENSGQEKYDKVINSSIPEKSNNEDKNENKTFVDNNKNIKQLIPNEGDFILKGRFGNNIRLGNNTETNSPNIKISVGQSDNTNKLDVLEPYIEDVNLDKNSIWITSDESVDFNPITKDKSYYLKSAKQPPNSFLGNQIIINSDRIIWNAKEEEILIFANKGVAINSNGYIAIDCTKDIGLTTFDKFNLKADSGTFVDSKQIILGKNAKEPIVLGDKLVEILSEILDELSSEKHPTGSGLSGPPVNAPTYKAIKAKLKKILSKQNKTL